MIVRYSDVAIEDLTQVWSDVFTASCDVPTADKYTDGIFQEFRSFTGVILLVFV